MNLKRWAAPSERRCHRAMGAQRKATWPMEAEIINLTKRKATVITVAEATELPRREAEAATERGTTTLPCSRTSRGGSLSPF